MELNYHIYKVTNTLTNKIYIGFYQGLISKLKTLQISQKDIRLDINKLGLFSFTREILSSYDTLQSLKVEYKNILSKDFFKGNVYNLNIYDRVPVIDSLGNKLLMNKNDPRYISGEFKCVNKGKILVKDNNGKNNKNSKYASSS
jgi:hypothetical protein